MTIDTYLSLTYKISLYIKSVLQHIWEKYKRLVISQFVHFQDLSLL